jgi:hypothetical protein
MLIRRIAVAGFLFASLYLGAQVDDKAATIVLPNPELIHCRSMNCFQLWKQDDTSDGRAVYPAQVLTDLVDGEVVGLTAVFDKSVSAHAIQGAIDAIHGDKKIVQGPKMLVWRAEAEQLAVSLTDEDDGTTQLTYLEFATHGSLIPSAHIFSAPKDCGK